MKKQVPSGTLIFTDLDPMHPPKLKRPRRTKAEMVLFRADIAAKVYKDISAKVNSSEKLNLEAQEPILIHSIPAKTTVSKEQICGWVNVYHDKENSYWLGSDIHYTIEGARKIGEHNKSYIKTINISFEL